MTDADPFVWEGDRTFRVVDDGAESGEVMLEHTIKESGQPDQVLVFQADREYFVQTFGPVPAVGTLLAVEHHVVSGEDWHAFAQSELAPVQEGGGDG